MRLWSLHPEYLDRQGLIALWREGLLAQKVLLGATKGYTMHPQLQRFRECNNPLGAIASYLREIASQAEKRGYTFDKSKITPHRFHGVLPITRGQLQYEFNHLLKKLKNRDPTRFKDLENVRTIKTHPLFCIIDGAIATWEKIP